MRDVNTREFYQNILGIRDNDILDQLDRHSEKRLVKKGEIIQKAGEVGSVTSFLVSGLFRGFFLDGEGNEVTDSFAYQPGAPLVASLGITGPALVSIEALEDSQIICIKTDVICKMVASCMEMAALYAQLLANALQMHWQNKVAVTNHCAKARYAWFLEHFPGLIRRVSHKYVASFLAMTPVSLSRVRRGERELQAQKTQRG